MMDEVTIEKLLKDLSSLVAMQIEPITMKEFYTRLGISRTKAFEMKRKGVLIKGRHYMQFGRKIIFLWGPQLLKQLQEDSCVKNNIPAEVTTSVRDAGDKRGYKRRTNKGSVIDINYCLKG